ncbi:hypothetical protein Pla163_28420 [Planctomycetes bacterium Pla163]|uniref:Uncharacterized protein n=1 Tax=Rohdeia mirabilis TaxID=2528008 RepID=A0A518D2N4_9BACT|nr:hypothetical protein Pla163_28420 [Planctomycetes bacterium Pla163]
MNPLRARRTVLVPIAIALALVGQRVVDSGARSDDAAPIPSLEDLLLTAPVADAAGPAEVDVSALRAGARKGEASGCLLRLVCVRHADGASTLHLETDLPGFACQVHLVESRTADGRRQLIHRERTGDHVRSVRIDVDTAGRAELVVHGEGETLRRAIDLPAGVQGPLERLEAERTGTARTGAVWILDPSSGSVRGLVAERRVLWTGLGLGPALDLWTLADRSGAVETVTVLCGDALVARRPAPGRQLVFALDPERFERLLEPTAP